MDSTPDRLVDRFASRHRGLVTREAAVACGLTPRQIEHRLATGRWLLVARALYRMASAPVTWQQRALAACLAGPPLTVASHLTAAALHGLVEPPVMPHVTVPPGTSARLASVHVHRSALDPRERLNVDGIPATSVARTLIDCGGMVGFDRLCNLVDSTFCGGLSHPAVMVAAIDRAQAGRGKKGVAAVRAAIDAWTSWIQPGSPAEMRLLRKISEAGLDPPHRQIEIYDADQRFIGRIDLGWPDRFAGFEYDSDRWHNPRHWERDEARQLAYAAAGWDVRRVGKHDLLPSTTWLDDHLRRLRIRPPRAA
jgi:predicted transcriptional regulator of viral defense system